MNQGGVIRQGDPWICLGTSQARGWWSVFATKGSQPDNRQRECVSGQKGLVKGPRRGKRTSHSIGLVTDSTEDNLMSLSSTAP